MNARPVNPWAALSALCIGFFMILLDTTIVSIAVPAMLQHLDTGLNSVVWVISVYLLTYAVPMLFTSRLGDRFGPKRVFVAGLVVFTASSLWCGLSGNVEMLIAARAVQGLGAALMTPQTLAFISHLFPPAKRGAAMGAWGGVAGLATITGPLLGGVLVQHLGWEWIFYVNVPIGVVAIALTLWLVPDWQPKHSHSFDLIGILLSAAGLFCVVFGVQNGQQYDWGTVFGGITVFEIIGAGVALLIAFVLWQRYNRREPLVPLQVFANRNFSAGTLTATTVGFTMTGMFLPLIIYIQTVLGLSPTMAGLLTAPMSLLSGVIAPFVGRASDKINGKYLVMGGLALLAAGVGIIALQARPDTSPWALIPALLVCGLGVGCIFSPMSNLTMASVEPRLTGTASGIFNTARQVGGVLGSAAIGVLLQARISASITSEAATAAAQLPEQYRTPFTEGIAHAAASTGEFGGSGGPAAIPGLPADLAAQAGRLASEVVHNGLTDAARATLILPIAVLVLGVLSAAALRRVSPRPHAPAPTAPTPEPAR
ncbi:DHA2 family efflux MFS transporter permease subunit [Amycolatopsis rubida]|uniref:DHA2 family efflux MFS transporter permease subunit n=1 Tax=Amycolatopsis rubida TaxID=112413 RepID=A0A1I5XXT8_9PSEU|nr:DHA2 family efflux MFS transporter permease subunit [Amycolatopsis rubida]MYW97460.1 DHA2 family efflux MFS transporter permease subunit [Amycolatopsis rubida]NEC62445.1 DHA2 family efflux MFS transporter permease subunit [Amycolatopsis rubida]SFQ36745.1 drug resistance transporter, EmrB/QacA subfamily [Amycolatopsis rubida]